MNDLIDYVCISLAHQVQRDDAELILTHDHWAYCPSGSLVEHVWRLTGGVSRDKVAA